MPPLLPVHLLAVAAVLAAGSITGAADVSRLPFEQARIAAIERATPASVSVLMAGGAGGGSAVLISPDGYALTNFHVVSPAGSYMRCSLPDGNVYDAVVVGIDPVGDLAMIQLLGRDDFPTATLGDSDTVQPGDWSFVIGNPMLLATNLQPSVSWGIISGTHRYQYPSGTLLEYGDCLQTDAAVNPGNSGGPLYNGAGELIGIIGRCSFEKRGRVNVGVGYAISINQAKNFRWLLASGRIVDHGTLGFTVSTDESGDTKISNILRQSDAYRRGLRYGDRIRRLAGRDVTTANDVKNIIATLPPLWRIPVVYERDGTPLEATIRLASAHAAGELQEKMAGALPGGEPHGEESSEPSDSVPEDAAKRIIERPGYANYYYNQLHRSRVVEMIRATGPQNVDQQSTSLIVRGSVEESPLAWEVTDEAMVFGEGQTLESEDFFEAIVQGDTNAIAASFWAWRRLLSEDPDRFGDLFYWGRVPYGGIAPTHDMLVGVTGDLEVRFIVDPQSQRLVSIECFASDDHDPAEMHISYAEDGTVDRLTLKFGDSTKLTATVDEIAGGQGREDA